MMLAKSSADPFSALAGVIGCTRDHEYRLFPKVVSTAVQMFSGLIQMLISVGVFVRRVLKVFHI